MKSDECAWRLFPLCLFCFRLALVLGACRDALGSAGALAVAEASKARKGDSICREGVIGRRMLYELYIKIKMLATTVELVHK